jgi:5-methylcytosine-specific restriction enzyme A
VKRTPMKTRYRNTGPRPDVVDAVYERAQHSCEVCMEAVGDRRVEDHHLHHRRPRAAGGSRRPDTNSPANLLLLCPECHRQIEGNRTISFGMGWLLRQNQNPVDVPVLVQRTRWMFLTADGFYLAAEGPRFSEGSDAR